MRLAHPLSPDKTIISLRAISDDFLATVVGEQGGEKGNALYSSDAKSRRGARRGWGFFDCAH